MPYSYIDKFFALLLVLLPIVQPLKTPFPVTWSMLIIVISAPYVFFKVLLGNVHLKNVWPVFLFMIYRVVNHGTDAPELITSLFVCCLAVVLANNLFDVACMLKCEIVISVIASVLLCLQTVFFYLFGIHIMMLSPYMLRSSQLTYSYLGQLTTGLSGAMYRPSAFFIEPSALLLFFMPGLFYLILKKNRSAFQFRLALLLSLGVIASTSGMGIAFVVSLWLISYLSQCYVQNKLNVKSIAKLLCLILLFFVVFLSVPVVQKSVERIFFDSGKNQYSAIQGRTGGGEIYLSRTSSSDKLFGVNMNIDDLDLYVSGFYQIVLTEGFVGFTLYAFIYAFLAVKMKNRYSLFAIYILAWTYIANVYLIHYYVFFLIFSMYGLNVVGSTRFILLKGKFICEK